MESHKQGVDRFRPLYGSSGSTLATQGAVPELSSSAGGKACKTTANMEPPSTAPCQEVTSEAGGDQTSYL